MVRFIQIDNKTSQRYLIFFRVSIFCTNLTSLSSIFELIVKTSYEISIKKSEKKYLKLHHFFSDVEPIIFLFRVKFFPADPFRLTGNSKILIYQQLKRDLIHGRLYCSAGEAAALGSLIVQGKQFENSQVKLTLFPKITLKCHTFSNNSKMSHANLKP